MIGALSLLVLSQAILAAPQSAMLDLARARSGGHALAQAASEPQPARPERARRLQGGLDVRYDDNILFLSAGTIRLFESGSSPQQFRIHSVDDFVFSPWAEFHAPLGQSELGVGARLNSYKDNSIKNYQLFSAYLDHPYGRKSALRFTGRWLRGGYAGELTNPETGLRGSVFYDVHELENRYRYRCSRTVTIEPRLTLRMRLYDSSLDNPRTRAGADAKFLTYARATPWLRVDLDSDIEYLHALSPRDDYDPSALRYYFEVGTLIEPIGSDLDLSSSIRYGQRRFTTSRPGDTTFRGRTDSMHQWNLKVQYHISTALSVHGAYEHGGVRAGFPNAQDEDTSFDRNLLTAGLTLKH